MRLNVSLARVFWALKKTMYVMLAKRLKLYVTWNLTPSGARAPVRPD